MSWSGDLEDCVETRVKIIVAREDCICVEVHTTLPSRQGTRWLSAIFLPRTQRLPRLAEQLGRNIRHLLDVAIGQTDPVYPCITPSVRLNHLPISKQAPISYCFRP